jgi:hypothetical protein
MEDCREIELSGSPRWQYSIPINDHPKALSLPEELPAEPCGFRGRLDGELSPTAYDIAIISEFATGLP